VTIQGILVGMDVASGGNVINGLNVGGYPLSLAGAQSVAGNTNLHGTQTYWIDNIQFIGPAGGIISSAADPVGGEIQAGLAGFYWLRQHLCPLTAYLC